MLSPVALSGTPFCLRDILDGHARALIARSQILTRRDLDNTNKNAASLRKRRFLIVKS